MSPYWFFFVMLAAWFVFGRMSPYWFVFVMLAAWFIGYALGRRSYRRQRFFCPRCRVDGMTREVARDHVCGVIS